MDLRILGPLAVHDGDHELALGGSRQRALLGLLLLHANEIVSSDRLVDELWGGTGGSKALQVAVSRLRKAIGPDVLITRPPGYELRVEPGQLDLHRFEKLAAKGRAALVAGHAAVASEKLGEALALWRGPPLAEFGYADFAQLEIARLEELRLAALEDRIQADLERGRHAELIGELESLVAERPPRERPRGQLMLALYRSGRQAEALEAYRQTRRTLVEELGIEPSRELQELERAILRQHASLDLPATKAAAEAAPESARGVFVGREAELTELLSCLEDAVAGRGRLVLLEGEPGIGKSRLAEELIVHARARGARVLIGRCWEAGGAPAYWPWVQSLRAYVSDSDAGSVRAELEAGAAELAQLLPELRELFPDLPEPPAVDPESARFRLFDAAASFLKRASEKRPIVLALDDLHAADEPSLLLLQFVVRGLAESGARGLGDSHLLVVGAYRNVDPTLGDPLTSALAELTRERVTRRIALAGLAEADVREYVSKASGQRPAPATVAAIHERSEGNALFVDELTRLLIAEGALERGTAASVGIPQGVRDLIGRRIRRLSEDCRDALTSACVLGREFSVDALAQMTGRAPQAALELLDEALEARAVGEVPGTPGRLRFSHAIARDTLYDELTPGRRLRLHARAGEALEALYAGNDVPHLAELAHHFAEAAPAGEAERAVDYARRAGDRAAALLAYEEAVRLYHTAIDALEFTRGRYEAARCELLLALGDAEARGGGFGAAQETFMQAADLARGIGAADQLGRAALGYGGRYVWFRAGTDTRLIPLLEDALAAQGNRDAGIRAMLLSRLAGALRGQPVPERRAKLTDEAVRIARRLGDPKTLAYTLEGTYASLSWPRDIDRWLSMASELTRIGEPLRDLEKVFSGHLHAFGALTVGGDVEAAEREFAAMTSIGHELRQPIQLWIIANAEVMKALQAGRFEEAERRVARALSLGSSGRRGVSDNTTFQYVAHLHEWALQRELGRLPEMRASLERFAAEYPLFMFRSMLVSLYSEIGEEALAREELERLAADGFDGLELRTEWFFGASQLADACERLGVATHAPPLYKALLPYADCVVITHPEVSLGSAARYLGLLASVIGRKDDAVSHYEKALETNERIGARPWLARSQADLTRTLLARAEPGDADRAGELARAALDTFRALGMEEPAVRLRRALAEPAPRESA